MNAYFKEFSKFIQKGKSTFIRKEQGNILNFILTPILLVLGFILVPLIMAIKSKYNIIIKMVFIVIWLFTLFILSTIGQSEPRKIQSPKNSEQSPQKESANKNEKEANNETSKKYIKGLMPADIYSSMEKEGFKTERKLGGEFGNSWTSTKNILGIEYKVEIYSANVNNVESVRATALIDLELKETIAAQQFIIFVSSLPYESSEPQKAEQWIKDNYNKDKATTIIGDARFTIFAPTDQLRSLLIEKYIE